MERHILSWSSGNDEKAVTITKIKNDSKCNIISEVIFSATSEGAVILEELMQTAAYDKAIKTIENYQAAENARRQDIINKVNKALNITLYDWQIDFIFDGKVYGRNIYNGRCTGKTLAHCLSLCLSTGEPIKVNPHPSTTREDIFNYIGEDGITLQRIRFFISELKTIYNILKSAGTISLRELEF